MNVRKHTITIKLAQKIKKMLLPHRILKNNILPKFVSLDHLVNSSISRCELDDLNKKITKKTRNVLSSLYKSKRFLKTLNSIKEIEDTNLSIKNILEEIQVLTKGTPKRGTNKTITRLNKLITALENLLSNIDRMSQEYSNIDAYLTEKYPTSSLISKIENCELALNSLYENFVPFKDGVRFYTNNIKIMKSSSLKTRNTITENLNQFNQTKELMEENNEAIEQLHSLLEKPINKLNKLGDINKLSETLHQDSKKDSARALLKQDIDALIKLINVTVEKHAALQNTMDESKKFAEKYKVKLESDHQKINDLLDGLDVCFHLIQEKYTDCNFTENIRIISQNIYKTSLISNALNKISTQIELLQHSINIDLIDVKQSLSQAKELNSTVDKLSNKLISLTSLYDLLESESESESDSEVAPQPASEPQLELAPQPMPESKHEPKSILTSTNSSNPISHSTQKQSKKIFYFLKTLVKNHPWKTSIVSPKGTLFEGKKVGEGILKFHTINHRIIKTTTHVSKMLNIFNTLEMSKVKTPAISVDYDAAISSLDTITDAALNTPHFFRAASTETVYRQIKHDLIQMKKLSQLENPDNLLNVISNMVEKTTKGFNQVQTAAGIEFEDKVKKILLSEKIPSSDKLINIYLDVKDYFYNKRLTDDGKIYFHHILLILTQVDASRSLENIKNAIIGRCEKDEWSVNLGGEFITIGEKKYKVPAHVKEIWQLIDRETLKQGKSDKVLSAKEQQANSYYLMETLSEIVYISEKSASQSSFFRARSTQDFYMDIANSKTFFEYKESEIFIKKNETRVKQPSPAKLTFG